MNSQNDDTAELVERITKRFSDEGRLIEAGWQVFKLLVLPPSASPIQVTEMRKAFFAGSQHLFASILTIVDDDGGDPTPSELRSVELIHKELEAFAAEMRREIGRS